MELSKEELQTLCVMFSNCMRYVTLFPASQPKEEFTLMLQLAREQILDTMERCSCYDEHLTNLLDIKKIQQGFM